MQGAHAPDRRTVDQGLEFACSQNWALSKLGTFPPAAWLASTPAVAYIARARQRRRAVDGGGARRPELLGHRGEARPDGLLEVGRVDGLAPHLAVPAEDLAAQVVGHVVARLVGVDLVPRDVEVVEVPRGRVIADLVRPGGRHVRGA